MRYADISRSFSNLCFQRSVDAIDCPGGPLGPAGPVLPGYPLGPVLPLFPVGPVGPCFALTGLVRRALEGAALVVTALGLDAFALFA